jgi:hypothetical protein
LCFETFAAEQVLSRAAREGVFPGRFVVVYHERRFPVSGVSSARLFSCLEGHQGLLESSVQALLDEYNGKPGIPDSFDKLDSL